MSEHKPMYVWSLKDAVNANERDLWRESYKENCDCARAIEKAIEKAYDYEKYSLADCAESIIKEYGFNRVNWVLANTVQQKKTDGRFSEEKQNMGKANIYISPTTMSVGISALTPLIRDSQTSS